MNFILGLIANNMRLAKYLAMLTAVTGLFFGLKHSFYIWHTKPLAEYEKTLKSLNEDLNRSRAEAFICESRKKNEVFEATNMARVESIEQIIEEARYEDSNEFNGSDADFTWMF